MDLFKDHSLNATSLRSERLSRTIERIKLKAQVMHQSQIEIERKLKMVRDYERDHRIMVSEKEMGRVRWTMRIPEVYMMLE